VLTTGVVRVVNGKEYAIEEALAKVDQKYVQMYKKVLAFNTKYEGVIDIYGWEVQVAHF
jgi:uncharacterized protein YlzI (FlbEa/FlbD family)